MLELGIFWGLCALSYVALKFFVSSFKKKSSSPSSFWRLHIDYILTRPSELLLMAVCLSYTTIWVLKELEMGQKAISLITLARDVIGVTLAAWGCFRWKKAFYDSLLSRKEPGSLKCDPASLSLLNKLFTLFISLIATLTVLHILGVDIVPLITFGGIGAAAMVFAIKDLFTNFFSGLMLHIARPFTVGDQVELPGKKIEGWVEEIGWCSTALLDKQKRPVYLPNSLFASEVLVNSTQRAPCQIEEIFRFRLETISSLKGMIEKISQLLNDHPDIDSTRAVHVFLKTLKTTYAEIEIKAYTLSDSYESFMRIKQDVLLQIHQMVEDESLASLETES